MFQGDLNPYEQNQNICLKLIPSEVAAGEPAIAQLAPTKLLQPTRRRPLLKWQLLLGNERLGGADSYEQEIPFSIDQPGTMSLVAASDRAGARPVVIARADFVVYDQVEQQIAAIIASPDSYGAYRMFQRILERRHDNEYRERLDLILCSYFDNPRASVRETAFELEARLHERTWEKAAARFFKKDIHTIADVLQETRRRAWRSLSKLRAGERFGPWSYKILLNTCRDAKQKLPFTPGEVDPVTTGHEDAIKAIEASDSLRHATKHLSETDAQVLRLRYGEEMGFLEIARALDIKPDSPDATRVSAVWRRVEHLFKDFLDPQDDFHAKGGRA